MFQFVASIKPFEVFYNYFYQDLGIRKLSSVLTYFFFTFKFFLLKENLFGNLALSVSIYDTDQWFFILQTSHNSVDHSSKNLNYLRKLLS